MDFYYFQPRYYEKFSCLADKCTESCCKGWRIDWFKGEYDNLLSLNCSESLMQTITNAFKDDGNEEGLLSVKLDENGLCPMLNEQGLCSIQKELGHDALSLVCRQYPRSQFVNENKIIRSCNSSCPAVLELIFNDERAMELEHTLVRNYKQFDYRSAIHDDKKAISAHPKLRYRLDILNFFFDILSNKQRPTEISLIIGALAAKKISDIAETNRVTDIPRLIHDIKNQLNSRVTEKSIEQIKPNYEIKLKIVNNTIVKFFGDKKTAIDLSPLYENGGISEEKYLTGLNNIRNAFGSDAPYRNLLLNMFLCLGMPFRRCERTIFENYSFYVTICAVYRMIASVAGLSGNNLKEEFTANIVRFSRSVEHSKLVSEDIMDDLNNIGFNSAAHLALIIK